MGTTDARAAPLNRWDIMCFHKTCCLLLLQFLQGSRAALLNRWDISQGLDISGRTSPESSGTHPLRDAYGTLTGQTIRTHANSNQRQFMQIHSKRRWSMWSIAHHATLSKIVSVHWKRCQSTRIHSKCTSQLKPIVSYQPWPIHQKMCNSTQTYANP